MLRYKCYVTIAAKWIPGWLLSCLERLLRRSGVQKQSGAIPAIVSAKASAQIRSNREEFQHALVKLVPKYGLLCRVGDSHLNMWTCSNVHVHSSAILLVTSTVALLRHRYCPKITITRCFEAKTGSELIRLWVETLRGSVINSDWLIIDKPV